MTGTFLKLPISAFYGGTYAELERLKWLNAKNMHYMQYRIDELKITGSERTPRMDTLILWSTSK